MTIKTAISSLIFGLGCYLALGVIVTIGTFLWMIHILGQIPKVPEAEKPTIVREFSSFLASDNTDSLKLQRLAKVDDNASATQVHIESENSEYGEWLIREDHRPILDQVRSCLRGEDNELIMTLLVVNYPRSQWSEEDFEYSQIIMTKVRDHWIKVKETFEAAANSMDGVELCDSQRQVLKDVINSVGLGSVK